MADAGDGLPLGGGHGGVEGPGGAEEQVFPPPLRQPSEEIAGEHRGGTAAARAAAVDVLALLVKEETAAVGVVVQDDTPALQQLQQQLTAQPPQVPGDDQVIEAGAAARVLKVGGDGVAGGGGHGRPHVVGVLHPQVDHPAHGDVGDLWSPAGAGQDHRPGGGGRPLGGGGALAAVFQGGAVLPLGGAEVGGDHHPRPSAKAAVQGHGRQTQALPQGGAGPVQPKIGQTVGSGGIGRADALVQQIPGKQPVGLGRAGASPVQGQGEGLLLHQPLRPLPGGLPQRVVLGHHVEIRPQGARPLLLAHHIGPARQHRGTGQGGGLSAQLLFRHRAPPRPNIAGLACPRQTKLCRFSEMLGRKRRNACNMVHPIVK